MESELGVVEIYILMIKTAVFSKCRNYRYVLGRSWVAGSSLKQSRAVLFICLNPSTADEQRDDPTVRRCIGYARSWGYDGVLVANLFAYRATQSSHLKRISDPIGEQNDSWLRSLSVGAPITVAAWGNHGEFMGRSEAVSEMIPILHCLRLTKRGQPTHPLYLPKNLKPVLFSSSENVA